MFLVTLNNNQLKVLIFATLALSVYHKLNVHETERYMGLNYYITPAFHVLDFKAKMFLFRLYGTGKLRVNMHD